jgi:outer membrane protein TolC
LRAIEQRADMKNINEVLKQKEAELQQVQREVEALRLAIRLLSEESDPRLEMRPLTPTATMPDPRPKGTVADVASTRLFS